LRDGVCMRPVALRVNLEVPLWSGMVAERSDGSKTYISLGSSGKCRESYEKLNV